MGSTTNNRGEKTGYSKRSTTFLGTPITERYNSKGEKTGFNKRGAAFFGAPVTERYNSKGDKVGHNKRSSAFFGTPITEHYDSKGEKTGYSKEGRTFWGSPIFEHYNNPEIRPTRSKSGYDASPYDSPSRGSRKTSVAGWFICAVLFVVLMILLKAFMPTFLNGLSDQAVAPPAAPSLLPKKLERVPISRVFANAPQGRVITMATSQGVVRMKNFYASDPGVEDGGVIVLKETDSYAISFEPEDDDPTKRRGRFWMGMPGVPLKLATPVQTTLRRLSSFDNFRLRRCKRF